MESSSQSYDVVVVGSGAAGLTAALTAALEGLSVVVIEKGKRYGGTTAVSGGVVWIPNNHYLKRISINYYLSGVGLADSLEKGRAYLEATVGDEVPVERREAFLQEGPAMLRDFDARTKWLRWEHWPFPDYYAEGPGGSSIGRALQPKNVDGRLLGPELTSLRRLAPAFEVKGLTITPKDGFGLTAGYRGLRGPISAARVAGRLVRSTVTREKTLAGGQALIARLRLSLLEHGVPMLLSTSLEELVIDGSTGRVQGLVARQKDVELTLEARRGVVLAAGGFARSQEMREKYLPKPTSSNWTVVPRQGQDGDGIKAGLKAGAKLENTARTWGFQTVLLPYGDSAPAPHMALFERAKPGSIIVNSAGRRYADESMPYEQFWNEMYAKNSDSAETVPSWLIFDQRVKNHYPMFGVAPFVPFPKNWIRDGHVKKAKSLEQLAELTRLPLTALTATIRRHNEMADRGVDEDFGRGETAFARFLGDPIAKYPNLRAIDKPPYYAVQLYPGDLGTKGGLAVDESSRVLREDGSIIEGLYACGNCSASVMGSIYPGPGGTIGPAMAFGYVAGKALAGHYED
jgi:3-oxosteroid 1-dehydrogenase